MTLYSVLEDMTSSFGSFNWFINTPCAYFHLTTGEINIKKMPIICVGPKGAGKTHLLSALRDANSINNTTHSVPSIGTNIFSIKNPEPPKDTDTPKNRKSYRAHIDIREVGGTMAPLWSRYYENVNKVIYVIDTSNLCEISAAGVLFYNVLADTRLTKADILLVLSKMDLAYRQMRNEAILTLQLNKLKRQVNQRITILETSAVTKVGTEAILEWIFK